MSGSIFGKNFQVSTWGESHGKALGVVIDGCPAGIELTKSDIQKELKRRKPGANKFGTKRNEDDEIEILSGVFEDKTTGTPISMIVYNRDHHSADYSAISQCYRPGHADWTFQQKYGIRDYRGGGRSSARETLSRVAAGAVAKKILSEIGISISAYTYSIGNITIDKNNFSHEEILNNDLYMPDNQAAKAAEEYIKKALSNTDSVGGTIECVIKGMPCGIGETVFDKLDAALAKSIFSIGAVKGFEIGSGFEASKSCGSINNDEFYIDKNGIKKYTNNSGGILGGMSDGSDIIFRAAFKPTPSIHKTQKTVNLNGENIEININGRHDPIVVPRAVVVVEAMAALTIVDYLFMNMFSKMESIKKFYTEKFWR